MLIKSVQEEGAEKNVKTLIQIYTMAKTSNLILHNLGLTISFVCLSMMNELD
jgi:hypothetical protein